MGSHTDPNVGSGVSPYRIIWADHSVGYGVALYGVTHRPQCGLWGGSLWGHKLTPMWVMGWLPMGSQTDPNVGYRVALYRVAQAGPSVGYGVAPYGVTDGPQCGLWGGCVWGCTG